MDADQVHAESLLLAARIVALINEPGTDPLGEAERAILTWAERIGLAITLGISDTVISIRPRHRLSGDAAAIELSLTIDMLLHGAGITAIEQRLLALVRAAAAINAGVLTWQAWRRFHLPPAALIAWSTAV